MSVKPPTEQESLERPLLPYEIAKVRRWLQLDPDLTEEMGTAHKRRQWLWKRTKAGMGAFLVGLTVFTLLRDEIMKMFGAG